MSKLQIIALKHGTDKEVHHRYMAFYEKFLPKPGFKGRILEIGIRDGSSLRMWHEYYPKAEVVGIDIDAYDWTIDGVTMLQMDSKDIEAIRDLGKFDVIIDDGSHMTLDQQIAFNGLYYHQLNKGGIYILEDTHTSLLPEYINSKYTTLQFLDQLNMNVHHWRRNELEADSMTAVIEAGQ